jgi:D-alanine-D-alanine ligase
VLLGDGRPFLERVLHNPPDFVWNLAEGEGVGRCREARVPAVLEMLDIPYSGSDPLTLSVALDKEATRRFLNVRPPHIPRGVCLPPATAPELFAQVVRSTFGVTGRVERPVLLKPAYEGSSKGIRGSCLADTLEEAAAQFRRLAAQYRQSILVEEFIDGEEVTIGVLGNGATAEVLGVMRVRPKHPVERFVYSLEVKRDWRRRVEYETPADLPQPTLEALQTAALSYYSALGCRDLARLDFRIRDGVPTFLEINPLPGLAPGTSDLVLLAEGYGIGYRDLILRILHVALGRVASGSCSRVPVPVG